MSRMWAWGLVGMLAAVTAAAATSAPKTTRPSGPARIPPKPGPHAASAARVTEQQADFFETNIRPVLFESCVKCHGPAKQFANLRLDSRSALVKGGGRGSLLTWGDPAQSLLVQVMAYTHRSVRMPPTKQLPAATVANFAQWVKAGAPWPEYGGEGPPAAGTKHWSFQPVQKPAVPPVKNAAWIRNPIDAFVLARLEAKGMVPAPPASRLQLVRRLYFDLTGLPPSPEEAAAFVNSREPDGYEKLVNRLLASPRYGERWARHWLDLVRYADTNGYERDAEKKHSWKYRDYVIQSLNSDKPYNRFLTEQLAGDEMPDRTEETYTATGFLRLGTWDDEPNDPLEYRYERLDDLVHTTATTFVGLTVKCARCHDHKFDPMPQKDYYAIGAAFYAGYLDAGDRALMGGPPESAVPYPVLAFTDRGKEAPPLRLLEKGDPHREGEVVSPGFLSAIKLSSSTTPSPAAELKTTGRRLRLAEWLTHPAHPLTSRVFVNRLWQHHFGNGLVHSSNNFGVKGDKPTHPELLDWLAATFRAPTPGHAWSIKAMHRMIVLSSTYRMASVHPHGAAYGQKDFANDLLWRQNRRRLDADALRDSMLAVSGDLNLKERGPGFVPTVQREALEGLSRKGAEWVPSAPEEQRRRTIYMFLKRALIMPLLTVFDFPDTTQPVEARDSTLVAPQALALLNNPFVHEQADALARRVSAEAGQDPIRQVERVWRLAFGRAPTPAERTATVGHLRAVAQRSAPPPPPVARKFPALDLALHLRADEGVTVDADGRVTGWTDSSPGGHHAAQTDPGARPLLVPGALNGKPVLRFDGKGRFVRLQGQVLTSQQYTVFAVVNDRAPGTGHRVIFSNWTPAISTHSAFLGLTANSFRLSDHFSPAGTIAQGDRHFILTGYSGKEGAVLFQDRREAARKQSPIPTRTLDTPYVIGQQGNINGEFWNGDLAELLVYNRELSEAERELVWDALSHRYGISVPLPAPDAALSSLCRVLLNSNEFIYVD